MTLLYKCGIVIFMALLLTSCHKTKPATTYTQVMFKVVQRQEVINPSSKTYYLFIKSNDDDTYVSVDTTTFKMYDVGDYIPVIVKTIYP